MVTTNPPFLEGNRKFVWFKSKGRNPTEYESFTVGQASRPGLWLDTDWPVRFDDGRPPYTEDSTAVHCLSWESYRDPSRLWQRQYVSSANIEEQALDHLVPAALQDGLAADVNPAWRSEVQGKYFAAWPFVDYGLFLALAYAEREALSDTILFMLAFEAADKLRHLQDIVQGLFQIQEALPEFNDDPARPAWMSDPVLVPTRENVELIASSRDWFEIMVATNLVFEPLVGGLAKNEFFSRFAAHNGDGVTGLIAASGRRDIHRHYDATVALVRMVLDDPQHAHENREAIGGWLDKWEPVSRKAAEALGELFSIQGINCGPFEQAMTRVQESQKALLARVGF